MQTDRYNNLQHLPIEERYTVKQSAAFIETNTSIRYTSRISNWPSSTRAELYAIFLALMISPLDSTVDIFTDSQCAIQGITEWLLANKKWIKFNNNLLLFKIGILVKEKNIDLKLNKVKGHSNDFWNDQADKLAKDGLSSLHVFRNTFLYSNSQIQ